MKKFSGFLFIMMFINVFSQNIKCEIVDYTKNIDKKHFSTYQYINAIYSYSRPLIIFITNKIVFMKIHQKIPKLYSSKQEYTDVFLLGIEGFDANLEYNKDKKIIDTFIKNIEKYRKDNNLINISEENLFLQIKYLYRAEDLFRYLCCAK